MSADKASILTWLAGLAATIVSDADDTADVAARIDAAGALDAVDFAAEALSLMQVIGESVAEVSHFNAVKVDPDATGDTLLAMQVLTGFGAAIGGVRVDWSSRPSARKARSRIAVAGGAGITAASALGADGAELYGWLSGVVAVSLRMISEIAASATPMVDVETGQSLPSTVLAYRLYGDAGRAGELVDGAEAATPMLMPVRFRALAS